MFITLDLFNQHSGRFLELERAVHAAAENGASAVKIQLFKSEHIWGNSSRSYLELSIQDVVKLAKLCERLSIEFTATAFDEEHLNWILDVGVQTLKIASRTVVDNRSLCDKILSLNMPTFVSCGAFGEKQLEKEFTLNPPFGSQKNVIYLYCSQKYPTLLDDKMARGVIDVDFSFFNGYSDHTPGFAAAVVALTRGARFLEKHFTFSTSLQSTTETGHFCSFTPGTLATFKNLSRELEILLT